MSEVDEKFELRGKLMELQSEIGVILWLVVESEVGLMLVKMTLGIDVLNGLDVLWGIMFTLLHCAGEIITSERVTSCSNDEVSSETGNEHCEVCECELRS